MWNPPERIKHPLPETRWPTASEAAARAAVLADRDRPAHRAAAHLGAGDGAVARRPRTASSPTTSIDWYRALRRGPARARSWSRRPASATCRRAAAAHRPRPLRPRAARALARAVREASGGQTRLFIQLIDFLAIRRRPPARSTCARFLELTPRTATRSSRSRRRALARRARGRGARARWSRSSDAELAQRAVARASSRPATAATASASPTSHLPHIARAAAGAARRCSPTPPSARRRPASTASSCTTPTPTPWRRSCRR